jgi:hypothetical protein
LAGNVEVDPVPFAEKVNKPILCRWLTLRIKHLGAMGMAVTIPISEYRNMQKYILQKNWATFACQLRLNGCTK